MPKKQGYPACYLHIRECNTHREWIRPLRGNTKLDLEKLIKRWIKEEFHGESKLDGKISYRLEGDYYAKIKLNGEPPDSVSVFASAGFHLQSTY